MALMDLTFEFDGRRYTVENTTTDAEFNVILLPDGRLIRITDWYSAFLLKLEAPVLTTIKAGDKVANAVLAAIQ